MTDHEADQRGHNASIVLENEAYQMAIASLRAQVVQQWKDCPIRDTEGALLLLQLAKLTDKFEGILRGYVEGGKMAAHKISIDAERNESGARRALRKVL